MSRKRMEIWFDLEQESDVDEMMLPPSLLQTQLRHYNHQSCWSLALRKVQVQFSPIQELIEFNCLCSIFSFSLLYKIEMKWYMYWLEITHYTRYFLALEKENEIVEGENFSKNFLYKGMTSHSSLSWNLIKFQIPEKPIWQHYSLHNGDSETTEFEILKNGAYKIKMKNQKKFLVFDLF